MERNRPWLSIVNKLASHWIWYMTMVYDYVTIVDNDRIWQFTVQKPSETTRSSTSTSFHVFRTCWAWVWTCGMSPADSNKSGWYPSLYIYIYIYPAHWFPYTYDNSNNSPTIRSIELQCIHQLNSLSCPPITSNEPSTNFNEPINIIPVNHPPISTNLKKVPVNYFWWNSTNNSIKFLQTKR